MLMEPEGKRIRFQAVTPQMFYYNFFMYYIPQCVIFLYILKICGIVRKKYWKLHIKYYITFKHSWPNIWIGAIVNYALKYPPCNFFFTEIQMFCLVSILVSVCRHRTTHIVAVMRNTSIMHWECSGLEYPTADALSWSFAFWFRNGTSKLSVISSSYTVTTHSLALLVKWLGSGRDDVGFVFRQGQSFASSWKRPDLLWGPKKPPIEWAPPYFPDGKFTGPWSWPITSKPGVKNGWVYTSTSL
jgi:hypothetical protein